MRNSSVYFSLGSNVGDSASNCLMALNKLKMDSEKVCLKECSPFFRTSPQDHENQPWFVNAVGRLETPLNPYDLLDYFKKIEADLGRDFSVKRFGPRIIDIDIIFYDDIILDNPMLTIPHERMHLRRFVLEPFCWLNPDFVHPVIGGSVSVILSGLDNEKQKTVMLSDGEKTIEAIIPKNIRKYPEVK